ncbi:MAG: PAS domain S-box protein, partial [Acidobacteria bacterium]|nr:PAS domain S-box protein [Acidobacteriota bacterium]
MIPEIRDNHPSLKSLWEKTAHGERYRRLFDDNPRPMWVCDAETLAFLDVNETAARHFGYTRAEFLGTTLERICAKEDFPALAAGASQLDCEHTATLAARFNKKDGSAVNVEVTLRSLYLNDERVVLVLADDVTEQRRAEEALRESERRYRVLVEQASDGIFICDERGRYLQVNRKGCEMLGYTEAELLRLGLRDVIDAEDLARQPLRLKEVLAGQTVLMDRRFRRKDGSFLDGEINASRLDDGRIQSIIRDITDSKRVKAEQEASAVELHALFAAIQDVIVVLDAEGRYQKIAPTNPSLLYRPPAELLGKRLHDVFPPERADEFLGYVRAALDAGRAVEIEYSIELHGRACWFAGSVTPMSEDTVIWVARDVTENRQFEQYLLHSEERYRELFENANDIVYTHDLAGRFTSINKTGERVMGYGREEALRLNIAHVIAPEDLEKAREMITRKASKASEEISTVYELTVISKDGRRVPLEISTRLLYRDGEPAGVQGIARDISERRRAERERQDADRQLRDSQERYRNLVENAKDIIYTTDLTGRYTSLNKTGELVSGYTLEEALSKNIAHIVAPDHIERARQMLADKLAGSEKTVYEIDIITKDGRRVPLEVSTRLVYEDGEPVGVQGIARDITERKKVEAQLLHDAFHDALTGLPNRAFFMDRLEQAVEHARSAPHFRFAVLFFDLDRFKVVNDSLGHTVGDKLLINIGRRLQSALRPGDTVARLGGDEFTILLEDFDSAPDVLGVVERMQKGLSRAFKLGAHELFVTTSIGIVISEAGYEHAEDYLRNADIAMHRAKALGKARYQVFDREMHFRALELMQLEIDLRRAIE